MEVDAYTILYLLPVVLIIAYIISILWGDR